MVNIVENRDCVEAMKEFPDKFFDLAVVDPPYGLGYSQNVKAERERESTTDSEDGLTDISRTGGTWAAKYGKK